MSISITLQEYYSLTELITIAELKYRQLLERVKIVKEKYKDNNKLIFKKYNKWFIHNSIVSEFKRKRKRIDYKLFITIASKNNYKIDYWKYIVFQLNRKLKNFDTSIRVKYVIEKNKRHIYHLHIITTFSRLKILKRIVNESFLTDDSNDMNTKIKHIYNIRDLHSYFRKQNSPVLLS